MQVRTSMDCKPWRHQCNVSNNASKYMCNVQTGTGSNVLSTGVLDETWFTSATEEDLLFESFKLVELDCLNYCFRDIFNKYQENPATARGSWMANDIIGSMQAYYESRNTEKYQALTKIRNNLDQNRKNTRFNRDFFIYMYMQGHADGINASHTD